MDCVFVVVWGFLLHPDLHIYCWRVCLQSVLFLFLLELDELFVLKLVKNQSLIGQACVLGVSLDEFLVIPDFALLASLICHQVNTTVVFGLFAFYTC